MTPDKLRAKACVLSDIDVELAALEARSVRNLLDIYADAVDKSDVPDEQRAVPDIRILSAGRKTRRC